MAHPDKTPFNVGEEILIVRGVYKKQGKGVYKGWYGKKMCSVEVIDGRHRYIRNIWLSSIEPMKNSSKHRKEEEVNDLKREMKRLQLSMARLTLRLNELEKKN